MFNRILESNWENIVDRLINGFHLFIIFTKKGIEAVGKLIGEFPFIGFSIIVRFRNHFCLLYFLLISGKSLAG
jgi:hypothetical protein